MPEVSSPFLFILGTSFSRSLELTPSSPLPDARRPRPSTLSPTSFQPFNVSSHLLPPPLPHHPHHLSSPCSSLSLSSPRNTVVVFLLSSPPSCTLPPPPSLPTSKESTKRNGKLFVQVFPSGWGLDLRRLHLQAEVGVGISEKRMSRVKSRW